MFEGLPNIVIMLRILFTVVISNASELAYNLRITNLNIVAIELEINTDYCINEFYIATKTQLIRLFYTNIY